MISRSKKTAILKPIKVIYNPLAGTKRKLLPGSKAPTLEEIKALLLRYQLPAKYFITKYAGHATELAKMAIKENYTVVVSAGGDGTAAEVANGLIGSDITMGILPLGTFMNTAKMLAIPFDLEKAVMVLKIGRSRKLDVGQINMLSGKKLGQPTYFLENSSLGMEAELQKTVVFWERHEYKNMLSSIKNIWDLYRYRAKIVLDDKIIEKRVVLVSVSNGPTTGADLTFAPRAKLNDHRLTISINEMKKGEVLLYLLNLLLKRKPTSRKITRYLSKTVEISTRFPQPIHADATTFGTTPVKYEIIPNALSVITGFPEAGSNALEKRAPLDPTS